MSAGDLYARTLAMVKRQHPDVDDDEARDIAHDWMAERASDAAERDDTPTFEDRIGEEELALRRELRES